MRVHQMRTSISAIAVTAGLIVMGMSSAGAQPRGPFSRTNTCTHIAITHPMPRCPAATFLHVLRPFHAGLVEHPQRCAEAGLASQSSDKRADLEADKEPKYNILQSAFCACAPPHRQSSKILVEPDNKQAWPEWEGCTRGQRGTNSCDGAFLSNASFLLRGPLFQFQHSPGRNLS